MRLVQSGQRGVRTANDHRAVFQVDQVPVAADQKGDVSYFCQGHQVVVIRITADRLPQPDRRAWRVWYQLSQQLHCL